MSDTGDPGSTRRPESGGPSAGGGFASESEGRGPGSAAGGPRTPVGVPPLGLPPRPQRRGKRPRILPIFLGLMLVAGFAGFAMISMLSFFLTSGGAGGASLKKFSLGKASLALVRIDNVITPGPLYDFWMESLRKIGEDENIQGVILRIESPGGSVASSQELYDEILSLRHQHGKTVYVSMGDVAASGGYYIAAAADRIFANRGTLTGSLGVISTSYQIEEMAKNLGIQVEVIKSGRFKDAGSMFRPMTPEEEQMFDLLITNAYDQFVTDILAQRGERLAEAMSRFEDWEPYLFEKPEEIDARKFLLQIADGRVYSGEQAFQLGLVDELGALNATIEALTKDLGLPPQDRLYVPERRVSFFEALSSRFVGGLPGALRHPSLQYRMLPF
jgi:protease IV